MFLFETETETERINRIIREGAASRLNDKEFIQNEISRFKVSSRRRCMIDGICYFEGRHDILKRKRTAIGEGGCVEEIHNLPNSRIVDNQYKKMVIQKTNYLMGKPVVFLSENKVYEKHLREIFGRRFLKLFKGIGNDSFNCGIGWLFMNYDERGELVFKRFKPYEVIPGWKDESHTVLEYAIRIYRIIAYEGKREKTIEKVEVYDENGIHYFTNERGGLVPDEVPYQPYFTVVNADGTEQSYNWDKIPLIPFRYNSSEIPLISGVKSLQDGINLVMSTFQNNMEEDARNTIMVLVNYDGTNLGEFRRNLANYGVVKVRSDSGGDGDVRTLQIEVNAENYKTILELLKKALIENAMGYDAKDDRLGSNANQLNIMSMYNDIDLDANEMETEYQAAFEDMLHFINAHLANNGLGDFGGEQVDIIFNRDMLINESEVIDNCNKSVGLLSDETILENHTWVDDPKKELDRLKKQKQKEQEEQEMRGYDPFRQLPAGGTDDGDDEKDDA